MSTEWTSISVRADVKQRLDQQRRAGESWNDLFLRLIDQDGVDPHAPTADDVRRLTEQSRRPRQSAQRSTSFVAAIKEGLNEDGKLEVVPLGRSLPENMVVHPRFLEEEDE